MNMLSRWKPHATFGALGGELYCNQCSRHFASTSALEEHFLESKFHFYCKLCIRHFSDSRSLENHHRTSTNHHHCFKCNISVNSEAKLTEHHIEKHAFCVLCKKLFDDDRGLHDHLNKNHHVCWDCNVFYTTAKELKDHYARLKKHPWCHTCREAFYDEEEYIRHKTVSKDHHFCVLCKRDHNSAEHLHLHFASLEHRAHKYIKCPFCSRGFDKLDGLHIHFEIGTCVGKTKKVEDTRVIKPVDNLEKPMRIINDLEKPLYYLPYHGYPSNAVEYSRSRSRSRSRPRTPGQDRSSNESLEIIQPAFKYVDARSMQYITDLEPHHRQYYRHRSRSRSRSRSRHHHRRYSYHHHHHNRRYDNSSDSDSDGWEEKLRTSRLATNLSWNGYKFECAVCFEQFSTLERLNIHLGCEHEAEVYRCSGRNGCGRTFPTIRLLINHVEKDDICGMGRWRPWNNKRHDVEDLTQRFRLLEY